MKSFYGFVNFLSLKFKREKNKGRKGYKSWILDSEEWPLLDSAVTCKGLSPAVQRFYFVSCRTSSPLIAGDAVHAWKQWKLLLLLCLWYIPTEFSFSVVVYTNTQHAQFLKLSLLRRMLILTLWRSHPPHTPAWDFSDTLLKHLSQKHTRSS